tara:strand:+ start:6896 stop:7072 length:177 start_codon:yes stop_codon:yes gene_type:complete
MKVSLPSQKPNCKVYGLNFGQDGVCESDQGVVQSLVDAGKLVLVEESKPVKAPSKVKK